MSALEGQMDVELRSTTWYLQLLMALHDLGETELCSKDPCHKLAWTLDACLKVGSCGGQASKR
jgi:hypothetical protein